MTASKPTLIFVAHRGTITAEVPAGVQLCTAEFLEGLDRAGFAIKHFDAPMSATLLKRAKVRLGVHGVDRSEIDAAAPALVDLVEREDAKVVVINMANLAPYGRALRARFGARVRVGLISHGNESGDHLKSLVLANDSPAWRRSAYRLGRELVDESRDREAIDHVFCLSETERELEHWLGADDVTFVPRRVTPAPLDWHPVSGRIGYVGTLDHPPNREGLVRLLEAIAALGGKMPALRLVGGPTSAAAPIVERFPWVEYLGPLDTEGLKQEAASWAVFVHPLFWYSRGASMKIAQALGWGIPIVTTKSGVRGYQWSRGGVDLVRNPEEMATRLADRVWSPDKLTAMATDVRAAAASGPTVESIAALLRSGLLPASAA
jgi:glycosyltransferase involved in cell wall biosynthesis